MNSRTQSRHGTHRYDERLSLRILQSEIRGRAGKGFASARDADRVLLAQAPANFLDTTHFDTVRFPPPPWAVEAFSRIAADGSAAYTGYRGNSSVLMSVGQQLSQLLGFPVDPERELMLTPGTQAGLFGALASLVDPGDDVVLFDPDYLFSERILRFLGANVISCPLTQDDHPQPDLNRLKQILTKHRPKLLVFSHPNNPTGAVYSTDALKDLAELAVTFDLTVLVDELYCRLVYDDQVYTHLAAVPGMRERTITLLGPSKTESLSGYRLGVVVAPAGIIEGIENVQAITALRAPAYAQHVLHGWLRDDVSWLASRLSEFRALREMTAKALQQLPWLKWVPQSGTAYTWPDIRALKQEDTAVSTRLLVDAGVFVSPGYQFGLQGEGHLRMCYARDEVEWQSALERVVDVLDKLGRDAGLAPRVQV